MTKSPDAAASAEVADPTGDRKAEHLRLASDERMQARRSAFARYRFGHLALPEIGYDEIDLGTELLGRNLRAPLLISCMTGGTEEAARINANLAEAAERCGVALGLGSQRKALEDPGVAATFKVRELAPSVPLLGNLGAVQLNRGYGASDCQAAVDMIGADGLVLHLNPLQEAIQPEGDVCFRNLLPRMAEVVDRLSVPVLAKEIGCGISQHVAQDLQRIGIEWIDVAGAGGTSWARIEAARAEDAPLGDLFADWGIETPEAIQQVRRVAGVRVIASGGVRNGVDVAKCLALGAELVGMAYPLLLAAQTSADAVVAKIQKTVRELEIAMFCLGVKRPADLVDAPLFFDRQPLERR